MKSIGDVRKYSIEEILKGKVPVMADWILPKKRKAPSPSRPWPPPPLDHVALSVDGLFSVESGSAVASMILRNHDGSVIFVAYRFIFNCNDVLEVEIHAIMQAMALALEHTSLPVIVQSDSTEALSTMSDNGLTGSAYRHLVAKIKALIVVKEFIPQKLSRDQNRVANCLTNYQNCVDASKTIVY
jgi:hypothetical protein